MPLEPGTLEVFAAMPGVIRSLLADLPPSVLASEDDDGWSLPTIVAHLVVQSRVHRERVTSILANENPPIMRSDVVAALEDSGLRTRPLEELLDEFERVRADDVRAYAALTDAELERTGEHSVLGPITIAHLLSQASFHETQHLEQAGSMLARFPAPGRGPFAALD